MDAYQFKKLLALVSPMFPDAEKGYRKATKEERLAFTLDFLGSGASLLHQSVVYGISAARCTRIVVETLAAINEALKDNVRLPSTPAQWETVAEDFFRLWQLPNCVGAIDGKHIKIRAPPNSGSKNYCYKQFFSQQLMGVADARRRFIYVNVGSEGRNNDAYVLRSSQLYDAFNEGRVNLPAPRRLPGSNITFPFYLVGDGIYPLRRWLLKPYIGDCTIRQRIFNYRLSRGRRIIEGAFGALASRFRCLYSPINLEKKTVSAAVEAMVHIHNFLIDDGESWEDIDGYTWEQEENEGADEDQEGGEDMRVALANYFQNEGRVSWQEGIVYRH